MGLSAAGHKYVLSAKKTISFSSHPLPNKTMSFIITKCVIISLRAPLTHVCQQGSLKLKAGHFISCLADKESFWVLCLKGKNDVRFLLDDNTEQNGVGTRECG